jgi:hypothetical protein
MPSMNEEDYDNLHFLLNLSSEAFNEWWDTIDEEDRDYALSILKVAECEIIEKIQEKTGDLKLAKSALASIFK